MLRHNDWMTYSYNNIIKGSKKSKTDQFRIHIKKDKISTIPYVDALYNNAKILQDSFNQTQDVLLSGGIDSEVIVRINKDLGIKQNLYTFRLEDDLNYKDVNAAIRLANQLNLKLNLIDFNAKKFVENKAESIYKKTYMSLPYIIRTAWYDLLDNLPVVGNGEQYWRRELGNNYDKKSIWKFNWTEEEFSHSIWSTYISRPIIGEWYLYTPEPFFNYHKNSMINSILNDEVYGKTSTWSSRHLVYKDLWPNLEYKQKLTGYEGNGTPGSRPDYIKEFEEKVMNGFSPYNIDITKEEIESVPIGQGEFIV